MLWASITLMALAAASAAAAQDNPDMATRGAALAERWCSHCHVAGPAGRGTDAVPPLATAAEQHDAAWLRTFLTKPHGPMPDLSLSAEEVEALVAYLATLR